MEDINSRTNMQTPSFDKGKELQLLFYQAEENKQRVRSTKTDEDLRGGFVAIDIIFYGHKVLSPEMTPEEEQVSMKYYWEARKHNYLKPRRTSHGTAVFEEILFPLLKILDEWEIYLRKIMKRKGIGLVEYTPTKLPFSGGLR